MKKILFIELVFALYLMSCGNEKNALPEITATPIVNQDSLRNADSLVSVEWSRSQKNIDNPIKQSTKTEKDTSFIFGDLLVDAPISSNFHFYKKGEAPEVPMGDTLYYDKNEILFGSKSSIHLVYKKLNKSYKFSDYKVDSFYSGKVHPFTCELHTYLSQYKVTEKDQEFLDHGINFAGHYTIFNQDCGCMCQNILIVDLITGKQFYDFPFGKVDGNYGFDFRKNSRLLVANSALIGDHPGYCQIFFDLKPEFYLWNDSTFIRLK